jgi:hypothetical protein
VEKLLEYLPSAMLPTGLLGSIAQVIGEPGRAVTAHDMVEALSKAAVGPEVRKLYLAFYVPLSTLVAHGSGLALLRHVDAKGQATEDASAACGHRTAVHTADTCVGLLAKELAASTNQASDTFRAYADDHRKRMVTPVVTMALRSAGNPANWAALTATARIAFGMWRYFQSESAATASTEARAKVARDGLGQILNAWDSDPTTAQARATVVDAFVDHLVGDS